MKIISGKTDPYLKDTYIENLFINEYMVPANGDFVKVYLFTKMYADSGKVIYNETLAKYLNMPLKQILAAWDYWESKNVIKKHYAGSNPQDFDIEFICLKQLMYIGSSEDSDSGQQAAARHLTELTYSENLTSLFLKVEKIIGRPLGALEIQDIKMWSEDWGLSDYVIIKAYNTCINDRKKKPEHKYISKIIESWYKNGLYREDLLENYLSENDKKHSAYKRIFKALGFIGRYPTEEEKRIMDIWLDEYLLDISTILEACKKTSGISSPNINYIHTILKDWKEEKQVISPSGKKKPGGAQISKMYEDIRNKNKAISEKRIQEVYAAVPRIEEIENELRELNPKRLKMMLSGQGKSSNYLSMEREMADLRKERLGLLQKNGYAADYLNPIYTCPVCKDTGYLDNGEKCVCLTKMLHNL